MLALPSEVRASRTTAPAVPPDMRLQVRKAVAQCYAVAQRVHARQFSLPDVAFDLRGTTAGRAYLQRKVLRFNAVLLQENFDSFIDNVVPHEVAHLLAWELHGPRIAAHGRQWKAVMRSIGADPSRTHSYDVRNSAVGGIHMWACHCRTLQLGARQHVKALAGRFCGKCGARLVQPGSVPARAAKVIPSRVPLHSVTGARRMPRPMTDRPSSTARPPTRAMLGFAMALAGRLGVFLMPEHVATFDGCASFIERHKVVASAAPSARQLAYARDIAKRKALVIPRLAIASGQLLSAWIAKHG